MQDLTYSEIFEQRGQTHDEAFRRFPQACQTECEGILRLAAPQPGETLLDAPSAGGFLTTHLHLSGVRVVAVDPSPVLHRLCRELVRESHLAPLNRLPLDSASVDVVVCLAGLHHEPRLNEVFAEFHRVLHPLGRLVIAEVDEGSAVAHFLNGFVNQHNSLGHVGRFFDDVYRHELRAAGFELAHDAVASYHWPFAGRAEMAECLQLMFGIDRATPAQIIEAVATGPGLDALGGQRMGMRWSLRHVLARPGKAG